MLRISLLLTTAPKQPPPHPTPNRHNKKQDQPPPSERKRKHQAWIPSKTYEVKHHQMQVPAMTPQPRKHPQPWHLDSHQPLAEANTATRQWTTKQDNCSALAHHLYSHVRHLHFLYESWRCSMLQIKHQNRHHMAIKFNCSPKTSKYKILPLMCYWKNDGQS